MGIESGPSGAAGMGIATGAAFPLSFEAVPAVGGGIINEGPFRGSLEGFRPMNITDIKTIADVNTGGTVGPFFEAKQSSVGSTALARVADKLELKEQDIVAEAEHWLGIKKPIPEPTYNLSSYGIIITEEGRGTNLAKVEPAGAHAGVLAQPQPKNDEDIIEGTFVVLDESPLLEPALHTGLASHPKAETKKGSAKASAIYSAKQEQGKHEQIVEEANVSKKKHLIDLPALFKRISGISEAVRKAKEIVGISKIPGKLINKLWAGEQNPDYISEAVGPEGPDGSIAEIREEIDSKVFSSEAEANKGAIIAVNSKKPIKKGEVSEDGEEASEETVKRVYKFHLVKPRNAYETVTKRVVKKLVPAPLVENVVSKAESRLEDYPDLAEVFKG